MSFSEVKAKLDSGIFDKAVVLEAAKVLESPIIESQKGDLITSLFMACMNNLHKKNAVKKVKQAFDKQVKDLKAAKKLKKNKALLAKVKELTKQLDMSIAMNVPIDEFPPTILAERRVHQPFIGFDLPGGRCIRPYLVKH